MRHWHYRLWEKVHIQPNGCWDWMGCRKETGHGQLNIDHKAHAVHRLVWEQCFGSIPPNLFVCHRCNNPACVNPAHLELGTNNDNVLYRTNLGRWRVMPRPAYKPPAITTADRFWLKVRKTDGCWPWTGAMICDYGNFMFRRKSTRAHRVSWVLAFGEIPNGLDVLHKCDNPRCVRPDHLFLGTQLDNTLDCESKGRAVHPKGDDHGAAVLNSNQVIEIRKLYSGGQMRITDLALRYAVTKANIRAIVRRKTWKHLED